MEQRSEFEIEERAAEAKALLNSPLFVDVVKGLKEVYISNLVAAEVGSQDAMAAHAGLKVVNDLRASLESVINDQKMRQHRRK